MGAIFRTSDVFAVSQLYLSGYTGHPPDSKLEKVALGADKTVPWEYGKSAVRIIKKLRSEHPGLTVVGLENNIRGRPLLALQEFKPTFPLLLVLGEEVSGISKPVQALCDTFVEIPQFGKKESLNVSVAFGIALYGLSLRRPGV